MAAFEGARAGATRRAHGSTRSRPRRLLRPRRTFNARCSPPSRALHDRAQGERTFTYTGAPCRQRTHTYARRALTDPPEALFSRARLFSRLHRTQMVRGNTDENGAPRHHRGRQHSLRLGPSSRDCRSLNDGCFSNRHPSRMPTDVVAPAMTVTGRTPHEDVVAPAMTESTLTPREGAQAR